MIYSYMDSPIGRLLLAGAVGALKVIGFSSGRRARGAGLDWSRDDEPFREVKRQLEEYFAGDRQRFELPLAVDATPFQARVLAALCAIPYGETRSYKDIAAAIGNPRAVRAVGGANGSNPLPLVIPCHRVIGSGGALTGFGGGMDAKRFLLDLESRHSGLFAPAPTQAAPTRG
ncbi:MAG: methylated-DNA--[protein]-cysteine S-methyltransferase [Pseudomonadales bacterium]